MLAVFASLEGSERLNLQSGRRNCRIGSLLWFRCTIFTTKMTGRIGMSGAHHGRGCGRGSGHPSRLFIYKLTTTTCATDQGKRTPNDFSSLNKHSAGIIRLAPVEIFGLVNELNLACSLIQVSWRPARASWGRRNNGLWAWRCSHDHDAGRSPKYDSH